MDDERLRRYSLARDRWMIASKIIRKSCHREERNDTLELCGRGRPEF